jgi:hypothetical protein
MSAPSFTAALAKEYGDLFNRCEVAADKLAEVERVVERILQFQNRYASIAAQSTVPWYVIDAPVPPAAEFIVLVRAERAHIEGKRRVAGFRATRRCV